MWSEINFYIHNKFSISILVELSWNPMFTTRQKAVGNSWGEDELPDSQKGVYLLVLVSCDGDELCLFEDEGPEGAVGQLEDVIGPHQMKPRLVLVHGVEDRLERDPL